MAGLSWNAEWYPGLENIYGSVYREDEVDERGVGTGVEGVAYASGGVFGCVKTSK